MSDIIFKSPKLVCQQIVHQTRISQFHKQTCPNGMDTFRKLW